MDAREIGDFAERFPGVTSILAKHGLDGRRDLIPVAPALHYAMGGIRTDLEGRSSRPGLWAVGEVASTGVHGANRLASNSLLEGLVFADRMARALLAEAPPLILTSPPSPQPPFPPTQPGSVQDLTADDRCAELRAEMRRIMTADVSLVRTEAGLTRARRALARLARQTPADAWRTANQILTARLIAHAALKRRESRGGHRRLDYPPAPKTPQPATMADGRPARQKP